MKAVQRVCYLSEYIYWIYSMWLFLVCIIRNTKSELSVKSLHRFIQVFFAYCILNTKIMDVVTLLMYVAEKCVDLDTGLVCTNQSQSTDVSSVKDG